MEVFCAALTTKTGVSVLLANVPTNLLGQHRSSQGANNEIARDVLLRALDSTKRKLTWRLFYSAGRESYFLNIDFVRQEVPREFSGKMLREVR